MGLFFARADALGERGAGKAYVRGTGKGAPSICIRSYTGVYKKNLFDYQIF